MGKSTWQTVVHEYLSSADNGQTIPRPTELFKQQLPGMADYAKAYLAVQQSPEHGATVQVWPRGLWLKRFGIHIVL